MLFAAMVLSVASAACALDAPGAPAVSCRAQIPAQARPLRLRGGDGEGLADLPRPDTKRLLELGKATGRVPYRRRRFHGDENPVIELARGVLGFAKGLGAFVLISGVASVCYALAAGPKRTSPPPVRTTTGLPYQPGDKPTGQ